jgi:O-antigen/teichoic acid export membrane protein
MRGGEALRTGSGGDLRVLVRPSDVETVEEVARRLRLAPAPEPSDGERAWITNGDPRVAPVRISATGALRYGPHGRRLATGEPDHRVISRRRMRAGVAVASPWDELVDLLLHCLLDVHGFTAEHRARVAELMGELRSDPPAAGRAAERVERELSPALPWSELLADVIHERWDRLLGRAGALERQLLRRSPLAATARALVGPGGRLAVRFSRSRRPSVDGAASRQTASPRDRVAGIPQAPYRATSAGVGAARQASASAGLEAVRQASPGAGVEAARQASPLADRTGTWGPASSAVGAGATPPPASAAPQEARPSPEAITRKQIRGSGLLLAGRGASTLLKLVAELIVVRYLATSQYGAWTYALSAVTALRGVSALGLNRAISRYLPLHLEREEFSKFYGVLVLVSGALLLAGTLIVSAFYAFPGHVAALAGVAAEQPLGLLFIVIFLVPVETIDNALTGVCAAFGDSRTIFFRRYVLNPGLRVGIALLLVLTQADATLLAYGYLFAGVAGVAYYGWSVVGAMRRRGLLRLDLLRGLRLPVRRVLSYTAPVMAADWCAVFMVTAGPLLLGYFSDMSTVALYQVVVPVATLNTLVFQSFAVLFEPSASRLVARNDPAGLRRFYWRSAVWVAVLTFPMFAVSFTVAEPLTLLLFGERYAAAAPILSLLAVGQFADSVAGFNGATLRVSGRLRWLIAVNVVAVTTNIGVSVALIPSLGALGAGIGTAFAYVVYTVLKQIALRVVTGVVAFDRTYQGPYLTIAGAAVGLLAVRLLWPDNPWVVVPAAVLSSLAVYASARVSLSVSETFPELGRSPLLRRILG